MAIDYFQTEYIIKKKMRKFYLSKLEKPEEEKILYCACPDSDPVTCVLLRYPEYRGDREKVMCDDAECQCPCHDQEEED